MKDDLYLNNHVEIGNSLLYICRSWNELEKCDLAIDYFRKDLRMAN